MKDVSIHLEDKLSTEKKLSDRMFENKGKKAKVKDVKGREGGEYRREGGKLCYDRLLGLTRTEVGVVKRRRRENLEGEERGAEVKIIEIWMKSGDRVEEK